MLLTRREVKMAGYWPRFFFAVLLSSTYSSRSMNVKLYDKITIICNWPSLFGQDDWILAKFLFCVLWPQKRTELICRHLDWTSLVNYKGFIMRSKRELPFSCTTNAGNPERARYYHKKPLRPRLCEEELGPLPSRRCQLLRAFIWEKRWPFCRS